MNRVEFLKQLIEVAQKLASNRVPNGDREMLHIWAEVIPFERYPREVWYEAVRRWNDTEDEFLEASTLPRHAKRVAQDWDARRDKRGILENHRQARLNARIARGELPAGTTPVRARDALPARNRGTEERPGQRLLRERAQKSLNRPSPGHEKPVDALQALDDLLDWTRKRVQEQQNQENQ